MRKELESKIAELLKDTELNIISEIKIEMPYEDAILGTCKKEYIKPIRESELLMALNTTSDAWCLYSDGLIINTTETYSGSFYWKLGHNLHDQSYEVIEFLHKILVR